MHEERRDDRDGPMQAGRARGVTSCPTGGAGPEGYRISVTGRAPSRRISERRPHAPGPGRAGPRPRRPRGVRGPSRRSTKRLHPSPRPDLPRPHRVVSHATRPPLSEAIGGKGVDEHREVDGAEGPQAGPGREQRARRDAAARCLATRRPVIASHTWVVRPRRLTLPLTPECRVSYTARIPARISAVPTGSQISSADTSPSRAGSWAARSTRLAMEP